MRSLASLSRVHREIRESNSSCHVHRPEQVAKRGSEDQDGIAHHTSQGFPLIVAVHGDRDPSVAPDAGIAAVGRFGGVGISEGGLHTRVHGVVHEGLTEVGEHGLGLAGVDQAPGTRLATEEQCGDHGEGSIGPGRGIGGVDGLLVIEGSVSRYPRILVWPMTASKDDPTERKLR